MINLANTGLQPRGSTHLMEVGYETSMTAQTLCQVDTDLPMLSLDLRSCMFNQRRGPAPSRPCATSQEYGASLGVLPSVCRPRHS